MENTNSLPDQSTLLFTVSPPTYVGGYQIGENPSSIRFNFTKKPKWIHRKFMNLCLGWKWIDG